jgi:hypothetical protein
MASERQIAANRRNAQKSTGPRSASGAKRSSRNAHRHGLTKRISSANFEKQLDMLTRQIAGDTVTKRRSRWRELPQKHNLTWRVSSSLSKP